LDWAVEALILRGVVLALVVCCCRSQTAPGQAQDSPETLYRFGTTVVKSTGLRGDIYLLRPGTDRLPNFRKVKAEGSIYTTSLNVPNMSFTQGFPGVTNRFEWFAIDYNGTFWIEEAGHYRFALLSDDGSKLYIDGHNVINNDGIHPAHVEYGIVNLKTGQHQIRVSYFQGPRWEVALVLSVARPGQDFRIFNTDDFLPAQ
jgi:hypothetical protein